MNLKAKAHLHIHFAPLGTAVVRIVIGATTAVFMAGGTRAATSTAEPEIELEVEAPVDPASASKSAPTHAAEISVTGRKGVAPLDQAPIDGDPEIDLLAGFEKDPLPTTQPSVGKRGPAQSAGAPAPASVGSGGDEPTDYERRIFRWFGKAAPISDEKWQEMVGNRREEVYSIQRGDTLWGISQTLFGDGFFWSKLWAENRGLENPHQVVPGQRIHLIAGNEANAPSISVGDDEKPAVRGLSSEGPGSESDGVTVGGGVNTNTLAANSSPAPLFAAQSGGSSDGDVSTGVFESDSLIASNEEIPPAPRGSRRGPVYREQALKRLTPEELASGVDIEVDELVPRPEIPGRKKSRKVLHRLPPSFVMRPLPREGQFDSTGLDAPKPRAFTTPADVVPNSYLADTPPESLGVIEEIEAQERVASVGQTVFLHLKGKASIGDKFTALYAKDKIKLPDGTLIGPIVEIGGRVQVLGAVNEDRNIYRASVVFAINPVRIGSIVSSAALPKTNFTRRGTRTTIDASIIGGEFADDRHLLGEGAVAYIDGGTNTGLHPGDILPIQSRRAERRADTKFPDWNRAIGKLKIFKVEESVASGVILEAQEEIMVGDRTGGRLSPAEHFSEEKTDAPVDDL